MAMLYVRFEHRVDLNTVNTKKVNKNIKNIKIKAACHHSMTPIDLLLQPHHSFPASSIG
jgi:hypothetical protein